ncbi:cysteine--tRNA ligase [Aliikangiella sp. IMCC44359]|uniref:cysteine--tRNA ligase n=1 Tax=Aliikangiella sp. IMCC44359 TaxID=3459125 RepID=UPI00403AC372
MSNHYPLHLFDSYRRDIVKFESIEPEKVGLYACGPTVYDFAHIGNLRTYLLVDLLRRTLEFNGYQVNHVMNITDVGHLVSDADSGEDKMEKGSRKRKQSAWDIALYFEECFFKDLNLLNIKTPGIVCRATDHIDEQIEFVKALEEKGFTYETSDGVYFDTAKLDDYGHLARLDIQGLQAGARVEFKEKRNITDFALWKFCGDEPRQMKWQSPWGEGFPGWHIECSAMAERYLGTMFDIHLGGEDHIAVHHSNEIAQSQARYKTHMANFWMHGYFLQIDKQKVAKSGKSILLSDLVEKKFDPLAYRYLALTSHYRSRLNFTWQSLEGASRALSRLRRVMLTYPDGGKVDESYSRQFVAKLNHDLNTPEALAVLWKLVQSQVSAADKKATILYFNQLLGLNLHNIKADEVIIPDDVIRLAEQRILVRKNQDWQASDRLRDVILEQGYAVEDLKPGYRITPVKMDQDNE